MATSKIIKEANVSLSIKGLALSNYNESTQRWEARFLRHVPGHSLRLTVMRNGAEFFSELIDADEEISILTNNAKELPSHYETGSENDFSHLINFNSPKMCGNSFKFNNKLMTFLSVSKACFYTKTLSKRQYTIRKNGEEVETRKVGLITGGDIVSLDKTEIIFAKSFTNNLSLSAEDGVVYEIIFDNDCANPPEDGSSDFDKFNEVIESTDIYTLTMSDAPLAKDSDDDSKKPPCSSGAGG